MKITYPSIGRRYECSAAQCPIITERPHSDEPEKCAGCALKQLWSRDARPA